MKICHFSSAHPANDTRVFHRMCKSLAARGHDVTLVITGSPDRIDGGVRVVGHIPRPESRWRRVTITAWRVMRLADSLGAEVYQFHDPELLPWVLWMRLKGRRVIYDAHEDYIEDLRERPYLPSFGRNTLIALVDRIERFCTRRISGVTGATDYITEKFAANGVDAVAIRNFPFVDELWSADATHPSAERRFAYVGNIMRTRGITEMVEACRLADVTLMLAGTFETDELRAGAVAQPGWNKVVELGHLSRKELPPMLAGCVAGLVLFHPEKNWIVSGPLKLFEYMSAGLPVLVSNFPLWKQVVEGNRCGICVDPLDVNAISAALRWFCDNPAEARAMGERGRAAIRNKFNWEREVEALEAFYAKMAPRIGA